MPPTTSIEQKVMEMLEVNDEIARLVFKTDYIFARQRFNFAYMGKYHDADDAIRWITMYLTERCGYTRR